MYAISEQYNILAKTNKWTKWTPNRSYYACTCTVTGQLSSTYGKYTSSYYEQTVIMEYDNFLEFILPYLLPKTPGTFNSWIIDNPELMQQYADMLMYTLPLPRYQWYEPSNF